MIRWTPALAAAVAAGYDRRAREVIGRVHGDLVARAAAFLLLSDSKASFAIEGERPSGARAARWAEAIGQAGTQAPDPGRARAAAEARDRRRAVRPPRPAGRRGFVGTHDRVTREPVPEHVSARPQDVPGLVAGIIDYAERAIAGGVDAVMAAAVIAFGFVYVHPFVDGNGRLHRWLVHHVLAAAGYNPPGLVFPVSAAILRRLDDYRRVLESYSAPLRSFIDWRATESGNLEVLNETADYYRYFDATAHAEFLYESVAQTVEHDLPDEVRFLEAFDGFAAGVKEIAEMPDRQVERLRGFLQQGDGRLSKRAREQEFAALTDVETERVEALYARLVPPHSRRAGVASRHARSSIWSSRHRSRAGLRAGRSLAVRSSRRRAGALGAPRAERSRAGGRDRAGHRPGRPRRRDALPRARDRRPSPPRSAPAASRNGSRRSRGPRASPRRPCRRWRATRWSTSPRATASSWP